MTLAYPLSWFELEPLPGQPASWREIDDTESEGQDADSTSSEDESFDHTEHFNQLALSQYQEMIQKDPENARLVERRDILLTKIAQEATTEPPERMDED